MKKLITHARYEITHGINGTGKITKKTEQTELPSVIACVNPANWVTCIWFWLLAVRVTRGTVELCNRAFLGLDQGGLGNLSVRYFAQAFSFKSQSATHPAPVELWGRKYAVRSRFAGMLFRVFCSLLLRCAMETNSGLQPAAIYIDRGLIESRPFWHFVLFRFDFMASERDKVFSAIWKDKFVGSLVWNF